MQGSAGLGEWLLAVCGSITVLGTIIRDFKRIILKSEYGMTVR